MIASDTLFDSRGSFAVKLSDEDIADFEVLRDVAMATIFGRPIVKRFALCYRTVVCLSVLSCL